MKRLFLFIVLLLFTISVSAQTAGSAGLSFLKIGFGARNIAMSDLGAAGTNDVSALFYNPANLARYQGAQIQLTHNEWIQDLRSEMLGAGFKIAGVPFAVGINTTSISDIEIRNKPGEPIAKFNANYFFGSLSTGFFVSENISVGLTMKYLYEGLLTDESTGFGFDFGAGYFDIIKNLDFGFSVRNLGSMNELRTEKTKLPVDFRAGFSYDFSFPSIKTEVKAIGGIQKYNAAEDIHFHAGGEAVYDDTAALRAGYVTGYVSKGFSFGLGLKWKFMNFDYAFAPFGYDLGSSHIISLMFNI